MRFRFVLDGDRNVYHDAAPESCMGRNTYYSFSCGRIPAVLLLDAQKVSRLSSA